MDYKDDEYQDSNYPNGDNDRDENIRTQDEYDYLEDKWYDIEDEYRDRYTNLTDEDVYYDEGRFDEMLERIGKKRGKSRREIRDEIEKW